MSTKDENQSDGSQALPIRWYCLSANGMATLALDKADAENVAAESDQLYPRNGPHVAVQMVPVQPDGRGTDAQIEKERGIARHAIVGAIAAGHAGQAHPGADHWLAAAHDAGFRIAEPEQQARCSQSACLSQGADIDRQQVLSINGAQPAAEVSDDQLQAIDDEHNWQTTAGRMAAYRAILALRPQAVPTTDAWAAGVQAAADLLKRMADETALERGETDPDTGAIQFKSAATREWHASLCELAEEIERLKPAHHGITAPAGGEG